MTKRAFFVFLLVFVGALCLVLLEVSWAADPPALPRLNPILPEEGLVGWKTNTLMALYLRGGWVMHFITLCSVLALAILLERLVNLRKSKIISPEFLEEIRRYWYRREVQKAVGVCKEHDIALARILKAGLLRFNGGPREVEQAIQDAGRREATLLRKNLGLLNFLAQMAPLLGLFGTVLGMTQSFDVIARFGREGNIELVASGIAVALLTTVWGLMVGIPALAFYHYFRRKIELRVLEMEEVVVRLLEDLAYPQQEARPAKEAIPEWKEEAYEPVELRREREQGGMRSYERPL